MFYSQLISKTVSAQEAVKAVKSKDYVAYSHFVMFPTLLDAALANRANELIGVNVRGSSPLQVPEVAKVEPKFKHITWNTSFESYVERSLGDRSQLIPGCYSHWPVHIRRGITPINVAFIATTTMDKYGFFNFGPSCSYTRAVCDAADIIIVETNSKAPVCLGGQDEGIHISEVNYVVEGTNEPLKTVPFEITPGDVEKRIADYILEEIEDGSCLQLGLGKLANYIGKVLAQSDLKDLGMHSEILCDSFIDLFESGKLTGKYKKWGKRKMVYTFSMGSEKLYEFLHLNPHCATYPVEMVNNPFQIALNEKQISVNNALMIDIYGQVCSEMVNYRQVSGTGGQLDFMMGAFYSEGGKSFLCLPSTRKLKDGQIVSAIVPFLPLGSVVTDSRHFPMYIVTEYGKVQIQGWPVWDRAEKMIEIAHPDFRDDLIKSAQKHGIWTRSNKIG
jgi:acyl-CoA hydrolase